MTKISGKEIVSLKNKVCKVFTQDDWLDIGYITDSIDIVKGHYRLLQSLNFRDDDYERSVLEVLKDIIDKNDNNINEIKDYIQDKYPDDKIGPVKVVDVPTFQPVVAKLPMPPAPPSLSNKVMEKLPKVIKSDEMDIFISHSSQDAHAAKLLVDLIKTAFNISAKKIRCTSVDGYKLPAGASTNEQLKREVHDSRVLIALISPNSMDSTYVLFELGARWATSLPLVPLVTNNLGTQLLKGPLSGINALNLSNMAQIHQLVSDLSNFLEIENESPAVYQDKIEVLMEFLLKDILPSDADKPAAKEAVSGEGAIKTYCENQWPEDFSMRVHCIKEQKEAAAKMKELRPKDIPEAVFQNVMQKAVREWPDDYTMQVHSRDEQISAYRELQNL